MIISSHADPSAFRRATLKFKGVEGGEKFLSAAGAVGFAAVQDDEVAGWCWGQHIVRPDETSMLYLHELEVDERYRRRGIGRELVTAFMAAGREHGAKKMFLTTGDANVPARALYESLGGGLAEQAPTVNYWFRLTT